MRLRLFVVCLLALSLLPAAGAGARSALEVADPTGVISSDNVTLLGTIPEPGVISARFDKNVMYVSALSGLTTYDVSDPANPVRLGRLAMPHFENEDVDLGGGILLISNDAAESTGRLYVVDVRDPRNPALLATLEMGGIAGVGGPGHTASCVLDCTFAWVTDGGGIRVVDLRDPASPKLLAKQNTPAGADIATHDVQLDGNGLYWVTGFGGTYAYQLPAGYDGTSLGTLVTKTNAAGESRYMETFGLDDGSTYNDYIHHNSLRREDSDVVMVTEEDYTRPGCRGAGSFQTWRLPLRTVKDKDTERLVPTGEPLTPIDSWTTELLADAAQPAAVCSAHYFDERKGLVAQGWYQQGVRLLDPNGDIRQVGYYITPDMLAWGALFAPTDKTGQTIYVLNATRGIDVISVERPKQVRDMPTVTAPILPQWSVAAATTGPSARFGDACLVSR